MKKLFIFSLLACSVIQINGMATNEQDAALLRKIEQLEKFQRNSEEKINKLKAEIAALKRENKKLSHHASIVHVNRSHQYSNYIGRGH